MKSRKLVLRKDVVTELTTEQLRSVAGASGLPCDLTESCGPTDWTGYYPSINAPCTD